MVCEAELGLRKLCRKSWSTQSMSHIALLRCSRGGGYEGPELVDGVNR